MPEVYPRFIKFCKGVSLFPQRTLFTFTPSNDFNLAIIKNGYEISVGENLKTLMNKMKELDKLNKSLFFKLAQEIDIKFSARYFIDTNNMTLKFI